MSSNLHEDASSISVEPGVDCLELWPPISRPRISIATIKILIPIDSSILRGVRVVSADLRGMNEACSLS